MRVVSWMAATPTHARRFTGSLFRPLYLSMRHVAVKSPSTVFTAACIPLPKKVNDPGLVCHSPASAPCSPMLRTVQPEETGLPVTVMAPAFTSTERFPS